jgi:hypothetical protein
MKHGDKDAVIRLAARAVRRKEVQKPEQYASFARLSSEQSRYLKNPYFQRATIHSSVCKSGVLFNSTENMW